MHLNKTLASRLLFCSAFILCGTALIWLVQQALDPTEVWWFRSGAASLCIIFIVLTGILGTLAIGSFLPENPDAATGVAKMLHSALPARGQEFVSGNFRVTEHSLHWKIYDWYYRQGNHRYQQSATPNLCSYFWTVVGKAPLYWFFVSPIYRWIRPWMVTLIASLLSILVASWLLWPSTTNTILVFVTISIGICAVIVLGIIGLAYLADFIGDRLAGRGDEIFTHIIYATAIIWIPLGVIIGGPIRMVFVIYDDVIAPNFIDWAKWWVVPHKWWVIRPITVAYALAITVVGLTLDWNWSLNILLWTSWAVGIIVAITLMFALFALLHWGLSTISTRLQNSDGVAATVDRGSSMGQMVREMYIADKKNVCPLMQLPTSTTELDWD